MNDVWSIGPFLLQLHTISLMIMIAAALLLMIWRLRREGEKLDAWLDLFTSYIIIFLICYKFGFVLEDFSILWHSPKALIFMSGGSWNGWLLGVVGILVITYTRMQKKKISLSILLNVLPYGLSIGGFIGCAIEVWFDRSMSYMLGTALLLGLTIWLLMGSASLRKGSQCSHFLIGGGIGGMVVTLVDRTITDSLSLWLGLNPLQCIFIVMSFMGIWLLNIQRKYSEG
jgi:prolipoprotein diacylglyceryltransferase